MYTCTDRCSCGIFVWQFLVAHAGPTSNVRVERASLDCFSNGNAVDEVISLCEKISAGNLEDDKEMKLEAAEKGMSCLTVHVCHLTF